MASEPVRFEVIKKWPNKIIFYHGQMVWLIEPLSVKEDYWTIWGLNGDVYWLQVIGPDNLVIDTMQDKLCDERNAADVVKMKAAVNGNYPHELAKLFGDESIPAGSGKPVFFIYEVYR